MTITVTNRLLTCHDCMLTMTRLKMSLVVAKTWSMLRLLLIGLLQGSKRIFKEKREDVYSAVIKSN